MSAARREGVTLGAWLDRAIRQQIKAERGQEVGSTLEDTLVKLVESMGQQATTNAAILARLEAVESVSDRQGRVGRGAALVRLYGLLRGRQSSKLGFSVRET